IKPVEYDPKKDKALLAEAGYPDGFQMTIHGPAGCYVNDSEVLQAVGQMLTRMGIETNVEIVQSREYSPKNAARNYSFFLGAWGVNTGEVSNPALALVAGRDKEKGTGRYNGGGVDDPEINELLAKATSNLDDASREEQLQKVSELTFDHLWILPMHYE